MSRNMAAPCHARWNHNGHSAIIVDPLQEANSAFLMTKKHLLVVTGPGHTETPKNCVMPYFFFSMKSPCIDTLGKENLRFGMLLC